MRIVKNKLCVFFSILIVGIANCGGGNGTIPTGILSLEFMKKCFSRNSRWKMKRFMSVGELMCFFCPFVFASERFSISNSFLSATEISTRETLASLHRHPLQSFMLKATSINLGLRVLLAFVFFKCSLVSPPEPQEKYKLTSFGICNNHNRSERLPLLIIALSCLRGLSSRRKPHNLIISRLSQTPPASLRRKCENVFGMKFRIDGIVWSRVYVADSLGESLM